MQTTHPCQCSEEDVFFFFSDEKKLLILSLTVRETVTLVRPQQGLRVETKKRELRQCKPWAVCLTKCSKTHTHWQMHTTDCGKVEENVRFVWWIGLTAENCSGKRKLSTSSSLLLHRIRQLISPGRRGTAWLARKKKIFFLSNIFNSHYRLLWRDYCSHFRLHNSNH